MQNLVVLRTGAVAASEVAARFGARVELVKRIPTAAGLGGGSSDAAAASALANRAWELDWTRSRLAEVAAEIGSDVPFFLSAARRFVAGGASGSSGCPALRPLHFVIVKPPVGLEHRATCIEPTMRCHASGVPHQIRRFN